MKRQIEQLVNVLEQTQWQTLDKLEQQQEQDLKKLIRHHAAHNVWFKQRLKDQKLVAGKVWTLAGLKQLKTFAKKDIQQAGESMLNSVIPPDHEPVVTSQTSGSTGEPVTIYKTAHNMLYWNAHVIRDHRWYGRDYSGKMTAIRATIREVIEQAPNWGGPVVSLYGTGPAQGIPVGTDLNRQIELLVKFQPNIIIIHAGVLTGLVTEWERTGFPLTELKHIKNVGDTVHDSLRERVKALTGLDIEDNYSSSEVGTIAIQCPDSGLFHVMSENLIVEILDESGNECKPGKVGRVVITDLQNYAYPIIRYDIGDYAKVGEPCTCGRHLPTLKRILGRERGLFVRPDGNKFWPTAGQRKIDKIVNMRQWQIIQHSLTDIEYRMVTDEPLTEEQHIQLTEIVNNNLGFTNEVRIVRYADSLPLFNGKYEESVCLVK